MTWVSKLISKEESQDVRNDYEEALFPVFRDKVEDINPRRQSVLDRKRKAKEKHRNIKERLQVNGNLAAGILTIFFGASAALLFHIYLRLFVREEQEREELIDYFGYNNDTPDEVYNEYRKTWNDALRNTMTLSGLYISIFLKKSFPKMYSRALNAMNHVFEQGADSKLRLLLDAWVYFRAKSDLSIH